MVITMTKQGSIANKRNKLKTSGVLEENGNYLIFTEDYLFKSPSGAAVTVYGGAANGWKLWKTDSGKTLDELYRGESSDEGAL